MSTKRILITALGVDPTEQGFRTLLGQFGPVDQIEIICEGSREAPVAWVEMAFNNNHASGLIQRITDCWHAGAALSAHPLVH